MKEKHRDLLNFLCLENSDPTKDVVEYRMKVQPFGDGSSPECANFGLKRATDDGEDVSENNLLHSYEGIFT